MIRVENLTKAYSNFVLRNVSFEVRNDEYFVILGPSGSGKSTLLECIAGIRTIDDGRILIDDVDVSNLPPEKRNVSIVFQDAYLFPHMTLFENIEYGLKLRKIPREERKRLVLDIAKRFKIIDKLESHPQKVSGGEKQRAALARSLVTNPKVLLLDEPLSSLDTPLRKDLREELKGIKMEFNIPFIHVTHDQIEALTLANKIGILKDGEILEIGTPTQIFSQPKNIETAKFIGYENIFEITVIEVKDGISMGKLDDEVKIFLPGEHKGKVKIAIKPSDIIISRDKMITSARNVLKGKIVNIIDENYYLRITVDAGVPIKAIITKDAFYDLGLKVGDEVNLMFKASSIKVYS
ncbi:MAG: ATP-binding cassette domain-containing protein [Candidatus Njordarchaeia archaeon]